MRNFFINILKVSLSNITSLLSGVLVGFLVPKMMGLEGYANFKIYTLYLTYISFLSLGFGDGIYLKFSGKKREELDINMIRSYLRKYYIQLFLFFAVALIGCIFFVGDNYRFICVALAFTILSSQTTAVHQSLSLITASFKEYSIRIIARSLISSIFVLVLFVIHRINGSEISYIVYICGVLFIEYLLALWYVFTYKEFNFGKIYKKEFSSKYSGLLMLGFPLLLSNMAGTIFLNLDRQFVSVLFPKNEYAIYAFAYNMLTLITTMTSAVSLVLFPSLRKVKGINTKEYLQKYMGPFNTIVALCLSVYFPLCVFIPSFLPKYTNSLEIFRIVLPGLVLSTAVSVILINFYKLEDKMKTYFGITVVSIIVSAACNYIAFVIFHSYESISWASIVSIFIWYTLAHLFFIRKYKCSYWKNTLYIIVIGAAFYIITGLVKNIIVSCMLYLIVVVVVSVAFNPTLMKTLRRK